MQFIGIFPSFLPSKFNAIKLKLKSDSAFKFRTIAVVVAAGLGLCGLLLGLSLLSALFGLKVFPQIPGIFFARSYGILALLIPVFLAYAAFILADPRWRPERIFILSSCIFPFFTLAIGFTFVRDFEYRSGQFAFLDFAGKTGFSFVMVLLTIMEVLALRMIKNALFPAVERSRTADIRGNGEQKRIFLLSSQPTASQPIAV